MHYQPKKKSDDPKETLKFLNIASRNSNRLRTFHYSNSSLPWPDYRQPQTEEETAAFRAFLELPAPNLEELAISCLNSRLEASNLLTGVADRLRVVAFDTGAPMPWHSPVLSGLEALKVVRWDGVLPMQTFLGILKCSPRLTHLELSGRTAAEPHLTPTRQAAVIDLLSLKTLYLRDIQPLINSHILSSIHSPSLDWMFVGGPKWQAHPEELSRHFAHHVLSTIPKDPPPQRLDIEIWECVIVLNGKSFEFWGTNDWDHGFKIPEVLRSFPPSRFRGVEASVSFQEGHSDEDAFESLLERLHAAFPNVVELSLPTRYFAKSVVLTEPSTRPSFNPPGWLFPNLKRLKLLGHPPKSKWLQKLVGMALSRRVEQTVGGQAFSACPLDSIHVPPETRVRTGNYQSVVDETRGLVKLRCDARSHLKGKLKTRNYFSRAGTHGPLYSTTPDDIDGWVGGQTDDEDEYRAGSQEDDWDDDGEDTPEDE